jgi:hypothetical protein
MAQIINIFIMLFAFALFCNQAKAHNMLAIMFNPHVKNMKVIHNFMGNTHVIQIVTYYDTNVMCFFLFHVFFHLNHVKTTLDQPKIVENNDLFFK